MSALLKLKREYLKSENRKWVEELAPIQREDWPLNLLESKFVPTGVLRSKHFLVQVFDGENGAIRMSVCRTAIDDLGMWRENISWDELQRLKREAGYGNWWAVEIYPPDLDIVNVANMRHLWLLNKAPEFAWKRKAVTA